MPCCLADYYRELLEKLDGIKPHYWEYLVTDPINCDAELERLDGANWDLCCALLTLLLREDHGSYDSFRVRVENRDVQNIVDRMVFLLEQTEKTKARLAVREMEYLMFLDEE